MKRVHELVDLASDAALAINGAGEITAWNRQAEILLGYAHDEVIGRPCQSVLQAVLPNGERLCADRCKHFSQFKDSVPCGANSCSVRHKNGAARTVDYSSLVTPQRARHSDTDSVVAVILLHEKDNSPAIPDEYPKLEVRTLGHFALGVDGKALAVDKWKRKQSLVLLKYLVTQAGRPIHRERIIECLWPEVDEDRAWDRLKVTISYLRQRLFDAGADRDILVTVGKTYLLRQEAIRLDTQQFEDLFAAGRLHKEGRRIDLALRFYADAERLYRGDYLEENIFADWCAEERERLRELYLELLSDMVQCHAVRGECADAVRLCRKALVHEPCRESFHRQLIDFLAALGHADQAIAQYRSCQEILARELGVEPMPETQHSFERALASRGRPASPQPGLHPI